MIIAFDMNTSNDQLYRLPFLHRWISEPHWISFVLINYVREWTSRFWEIEEFHVWSMAGHLLGHYWNNGYNTFLENHWDVCNFAKLVDLHFRQRMNLKFDTNLLLFWSTFWLMDKVTKFSTGHFPFVSKIIEAKIMWSGVSKNLIVANWMLQQQRKPSQIPFSTFRRAFSNSPIFDLNHDY